MVLSRTRSPPFQIGDGGGGSGRGYISQVERETEGKVADGDRVVK